MTARRLYAPVVLATLAAGGLAFFAAGRTWVTSEVVSEGLAPATVSVSGTDAQPLVSALALVVITTSLAILAAGPRLRQAVGVLTILAAATAAIVVPRSGSNRLADALTSAAEKSAAYSGPASMTDVSHKPWDLVTIAAFVIAVVLGALTVRFGPQWPTMSSRYDAPSTRPATNDLSDSDMWKAMDDGHDPTAEPDGRTE